MTKIMNGVKILMLLSFVGLTQSACVTAPTQLDSFARVQKLQLVACSHYDRRGRG